MPARHEANDKVVDLLVDRWSPRSFDQSEMPEADLDAIFEAAGWAPSSYNVQPWRFLYARRGDTNWEQFTQLINDFNQKWATDASVLIFVLSHKVSSPPGGEPEPNRTHSFDAGAAWQNMALQATAMGYHAHGMGGIHHDKIREELSVPDEYRIECGVAIGTQAPAEQLPEDLQDEEKKSGRNPVSEFAFAGAFPS